MSTFHPEIDAHSHDDMIYMATVTKIPRLWIWLRHVPVTMCMSACVHLCLCAWACVCLCVCVCVCVCECVCKHVCMDIKNMCMCLYGICMCSCMGVEFFYLYSYGCAVTLHLMYDYPSQVSNDAALIHMYNIHYYYSLQDRWDVLILHLQKKFLILCFIVTQIKYFCLLDLFI